MCQADTFEMPMRGVVTAYFARYSPTRAAKLLHAPLVMSHAFIVFVMSIRSNNTCVCVCVRARTRVIRQRFRAQVGRAGHAGRKEYTHAYRQAGRQAGTDARSHAHMECTASVDMLRSRQEKRQRQTQTQTQTQAQRQRQRDRPCFRDMSPR